MIAMVYATAPRQTTSGTIGNRDFSNAILLASLDRIIRCLRVNQADSTATAAAAFVKTVIPKNV